MKKLVLAVVVLTLALAGWQFTGSQQASKSVVETIQAASQGVIGSSMFLSSSGQQLILTSLVGDRLNTVILCLVRCNAQVIYTEWLTEMTKASLAGTKEMVVGWQEIVPSQIPNTFKGLLGINTFQVLMNTISARGMSLAMRMANTPYLVFVLPVQLLDQPNLSTVAQ
jgi:hypothetical protein